MSAYALRYISFGYDYHKAISAAEKPETGIPVVS